MTQIPGVHVETIHPPQQYALSQIEHAIRVAEAMQRGKLVICTPPLGDTAQENT